MPNELKELLEYLKVNYKKSNKSYHNKILGNKAYKKLEVYYVDRILKDYTLKRFLDLGICPEYNPQWL